MTEKEAGRLARAIVRKLINEVLDEPKFRRVWDGWSAAKKTLFRETLISDALTKICKETD